MRTLSIVAASALVLLAPRLAAAEFVSYGPAQTDGYGVTFSVGESYCPDFHSPYPYAVRVPAPVYIPVPVVVYPPPPPPVVVYPPFLIYRSVIAHRPFVERRVIVREIVRKPVVVERRVVVREREIARKRHSDHSGRHWWGFAPGLRRTGQRN
jgi:hypothetical protein